MEEKIIQSETRQFRLVFPNTINANGTLFGGLALKWMDEVAYITATRFTRQKMVTINTENIKFIKAVQPNTILEIVGNVRKVNNIKLHVSIEIFSEELYGNLREKVIEGVFVFASLSDNNRPIRISV